MKNLKSIILSVILFLAAHSSDAQKIKLTITDNIAESSKLTIGKAKPADPKESFKLLGDKGTQVIFFADILSDIPASDYHIKFSAFSVSDDGKDEWYDDRTMALKPSNSYTIAGINFFDPGKYKIVVTHNESGLTIAEGVFTITK